ncbi:hypothetical protein N6H14_33225 [Paenibacillus sp. CC-CFT747]|nr:hypothetical protein N6H14_33225 [Paenibacillus sp. CC-CFT747]
MTFFVVLVVALIVFGVVLPSTRKRKRSVYKGGSKPRPARKQVEYRAALLPEGLGLRPGVPLEAMEQRLNQALDAEFQNKLKQRVRAKHPSIRANEYDCLFFELKRYFMLTAILKQVPMFSSRVDDVWHEMLLFTREYQSFGEAFTGSPIHHSPHTDNEPMPGERAWFDWVYTQLFVLTPYSGQIWNDFYRRPLDRARLKRISEGTPEELKDLLFNGRHVDRFGEIARTADLLVEKARIQLRERDRASLRSEATSKDRYSDGYAYLLANAMLLYSWESPGRYDKQMEELMAEEQRSRQAAASTTSSDSGGYYSSDSGSWGEDRSHKHDHHHDGGQGSHHHGNHSHHHQDGHHGGHDSGGGHSGGHDSGSSCSSSSCGSGCGGGGD